MGQRGLDGRREDPELRDVNHDEKNRAAPGRRPSDPYRCDCDLVVVLFDPLRFASLSSSYEEPGPLLASLPTAHTPPLGRTSNLIGSRGRDGGPYRTLPVFA